MGNNMRKQKHSDNWSGSAVLFQHFVHGTRESASLKVITSLEVNPNQSVIHWEVTPEIFNALIISMLSPMILVLVTDPMLKRTRVTVKLLEAKDLLVSDLPTGTSDPVAMVWIGSVDEGSIVLQKDIHVQVYHCGTRFLVGAANSRSIRL